MRMFALSAGGKGLSVKAREDYYHTTVLAERAALRMQRAAASMVRVVLADVSEEESEEDETVGASPSVHCGGTRRQASDGGSTADDGGCGPAHGATPPRSSRPTRQTRTKRQLKCNKKLLETALSMLMSTASPNDADVFAALMSDDDTSVPCPAVDRAHDGRRGDTTAVQGDAAESRCDTSSGRDGAARGPDDGLLGGAQPPSARVRVTSPTTRDEVPHSSRFRATNRATGSPSRGRKHTSKRKRTMDAVLLALERLQTMAGPVESAFPTASSFVNALDGEANRCLAEQQWRKTEMFDGDSVFLFYSRDVMVVALEAFMKATALCLRGKRLLAADGSVLLSNSLNSDVYLTEQTDVDQIHANKTYNGTLLKVFTLAIQLFSDATLVSWKNGTYFFDLVGALSIDPTGSTSIRSFSLGLCLSFAAARL